MIVRALHPTRWWLFLACIMTGFDRDASGQTPPLPALEDMLLQGRDVWGEAAMEQVNGASFEFFKDLIPPPRYVHADYRYYPLILSAPKAPVKASLVSNGCGLNLRGGARSWHENGTPVSFRVGPDEFLFGGLAERLAEPTLEAGYLPIYTIVYEHPSPIQSEGAVPLQQTKVIRPRERYRLESFASTNPAFAHNAVVCLRFDLEQGNSGVITLDFDANSKLRLLQGRIVDEEGKVYALLDSRWKWERNRAHAQLTTASAATAFIPTLPLDSDVALKCTQEQYEEERETSRRTWEDYLKQAMKVETPEAMVNHAWKNLLIQNESLMRGSKIHYSALNQYDALYESEGSDAALAALVWGLSADVRKMIEPLFDFRRKGLEYHNAGTKLLNLCRYYWMTRDAEAIKQLRPRWEQELKMLLENREADHGLFPKERYCGDISTPVHSLNVNAKAWRALRDMSAVLEETGERELASSVRQAATEYRRVVLDAIDKSVRRNTQPPFVPIALYDNEPAHNPITHVRIGSYWNIIIGYSIASGIFPPGSDEENWIPRYQENFGGICMGMIRSGGAQFNFWSGEHRVNPLYGTRYTLDTLRRDDPERALVSFYGMLAQGMTRNTFIGGEGSTLHPVDARGRFFYCPPNSASNAHFLSMLRYQLVQDWDMDDDGAPDTLRLLFGTSRRWLEDGKAIVVEEAPTAFGPVSIRVHSQLNAAHIEAIVKLPKLARPVRTAIRLRVPEGYLYQSATVDGRNVPVDAQGTIELANAAGGEVSIRLTLKAIGDR